MLYNDMFGEIADGTSELMSLQLLIRQVEYQSGGITEMADFSSKLLPHQAPDFAKAS